jgi:hypothetical protein
MSEIDVSSSYAPSVGKRLLWWFGIYLCGAIIVSILTKEPTALLFFPGGLFFAAGPLLPRVWIDSPFIGLAALAVCGFAYLIHLILTVAISSQLIYRFLMVVLIVMVVIDSVGYVSNSYLESSPNYYHGP